MGIYMFYIQPSDQERYTWSLCWDLCIKVCDFPPSHHLMCCAINTSSWSLALAHPWTWDLICETGGEGWLDVGVSCLASWQMLQRSYQAQTFSGSRDQNQNSEHGHRSCHLADAGMHWGFITVSCDYEDPPQLQLQNNGRKLGRRSTEWWSHHLATVSH